MIQPEDFYKETNDHFKGLSQKIDKLHKETQDDIRILTSDIGKVNSKLDTHVAVVKALKGKEIQVKSDSTKKQHFITGVIISVGLGIMTIISLFTE